VSNAILKNETTIDMESINCYIKPQYTSNSQKIIDTKNMLNKYVLSKITYDFGKQKDLLDGSTINKWLTVDENLEVKFDESEVKNYIDVLSNKYNTIGKNRKFVSSSGKTINIGGGDYGWSINRAKETQSLITAIKEGQTIAKEPKYIQTALSHGNNDIGNTYVEIDLTKQHLWFYKNGSLIAQGDVVTGNVNANHTTPGGIYKLKYKARNAVLRGPGYAAPVTYWMPFNGGIGIHDASWRNVFGGRIYKINGSHGCINSPYYLAKAIFDNIQIGIPVICYN
jgi:lipoprotein-anchoring transpeptidase ErfK/SrfK